LLLPRKHQITNLPTKRFYLLILALFVFNLLLSLLLPITADEAYYYLWSQHLDLSYFDHPPMVAYMIAFSRMLFGDGALGIRFFPLILSALVPLLWLTIFHRDHDETFYMALWAVPVLQVALFFMTPDVPFFFFSSLFILHYLRKREPDFTGGILLGLSLLSKYMAVLLFPSLIVFAYPKNRLKFCLYYVALPFIIFLPVIWFNASHDFVSFKYQLFHGSGGFVVRTGYFVKYIVDVIVAGGVPLSIAGILGLNRLLSDNKKFLFALGLTFFLFFAFFSFFSRQEANWPLLFYPVLLYSGYMFTKSRKSGMYIMLLYFILSLPFKPFLLVPPLKERIFRKEIVMRDIAYRLKSVDLPIFANTYQHASLLSYYLKRFVPSLNIKSRPNQFDLWKVKLPEDRFVFVAIGYPDVMSRFVVDSTLFVMDNISVYLVRLK